jgi:glycosyltransferase involved in cell wall biosynthesis
MSARRRCFFLNRFYWPEEPATGQLLADLASALAATGLAVTVIASAPAHPKVPRCETHRGVEIRRIHTPRLGGRGAFARVFDWGAFSLAALWRIWREVRSGDTVVLLTDPPLFAIAAAPLARRRGARVIHYVQDIYPELAEVLNGARGLGWLRTLLDRSWRRADACVVLGRDMAALLAVRGVHPARIRIIPNWVPEGLAPASATAIAQVRTRWGLADRFVVAYAGNLGRVHDLDPVLAVAATLQSVPEYVFLFIGDGAQRPRLESLTRVRGLNNVRFLPHQPRAELAACLGAADVHLVTLRTGCEALVFPSKLYGIAAVGRPVLFIGPPGCEVAQQIESAAMGRAFARGDTVGIAECLQHWRQNPMTHTAFARGAAAFALATGGLPRAATAWRELLTETRHPPASAPSRL